MMLRLTTAALLAAVLLLSGCATPVGVNRVTPREAYLDAYANPLNMGVASDRANAVLNRFNLRDAYRDSPGATLATLHDKALSDERRDNIYALAELSYLYADALSSSFDPEEQGLAPDYFLLSAVYASSYLLEDRSDPLPHIFDERLRTALNLYNFSLWRGFATGANGELVLGAQSRKLPIGTLIISPSVDAFPWKLDEFEKFESAEKFAVRGISVRNRSQGVGMPLVGLRKPDADSAFGGQATPVTVFLRLNSRLDEFRKGDVRASLEFYSTFDDTEIDVRGKKVPLETDTTTPLAYKLEGSRAWDFGLGAFLGREFGTMPNGIYLLGPYRPGRIPVVFVHGTASSPVWWTEMFNTLRADPTLRKKFQFWFFIYKSSNLIALSAEDLRNSLQERVASLDPKGLDGALQQMVVVGHSQGGLLTKFTAVDTGEKLAVAVLGTDLGSLDATESQKEYLRRVLVVKPLPFVKQVVFIATPHRGSFRSTLFSRRLVSMMVTLPASVIARTADLYSLLSADMKGLLRGGIGTSADGMSPDNPLLKALAEISLAPGIHGHSIIAIDGDGDPKEGNDGVVEYSSAHLDGMDSEFIVRSGHSCQMHPFTIEEVRRILLEHLAGGTASR